jgi:mono/diheme cytochrome c family protein
VTAGLFIAFWVVLGIGLVVIAASGGLRGARETVLQRQTKRARGVFAAVFAVAYIGLGVAIPAVVIAGDRDDKVDSKTGQTLTAAELHGREVFGQKCQQCHTLRGANAVGKVGPNFDQLRPSKAVVLDAVAQGRVRGAGTMPAQLVQGKDAVDVAAFVAAVAGRD